MRIFARNFRGFKRLSLDLDKNIFLVGDNSSGKSSILYLIEAISENDLNMPPQLDEDFGVSRYDYFSPYFNFKDVVFGFFGTSDPTQNIAKVITVKKTDEPTPRITKCTYWIPGMAVRLRYAGSKVRVCVSEAPEKIDEPALLRLHNSVGRFEKNEMISSVHIAENHSLMMCMDTENKKQDEFIKKIWNINIKGCRVTSPIRALPERFYENRRKFHAQGRHFARVWLDLYENNPDVFTLIDEFGKESGLFEKLQVEPVSDHVEDPPLFVSVIRNGKVFSLNQVGVGVSQIVPILMDSVFSLKIDHRYLLVQQPELHLHPIAQAALGTYFYKISKLGLSCVFETHSSYFIDRFRSEVRSDGAKIAGPAGDVVQKQPGNAEKSRLRLPSIVFCEARADGNVAHIVQILQDGTLKGEPNSFHQFFVDELLRTMF